ncbi:hypothetical protein [unidentified bacterial endosymbiont]|uniref:hypothetical protein n=1 Tax=unidentified bacterial endosymbiont TaxID=2355 RepID=UPI0020A06737|nr:hypothetical protein [unidentified bacterial endosymbiont]
MNRLFLIRFLSAIAFYICIVISNQYGVIATTIFTMGHRSLLFFSPYLSKSFKNYDGVVSLAISAIGVFFLLLFKWNVLGVIFIAFGLSTHGFIIKSIAADSAENSGKNKIAINFCNIGAGLILLLITMTILMMATFISYVSFSSIKHRKEVAPLTFNAIKENKSLYFIWLCFGMAIGIRVFGLYIIMPEYLINTLGELPAWYGLTLMLYGGFVILTQYYVIIRRGKVSLYISMLALAISCVIMSIPSFFKIETLSGALIWVTCLALEEVFTPYIDCHASKTNTLLVKELAIGLGGALCALLTHTFFCIEFLGKTAILCLVIGMTVLYYSKHRTV